MTNVEVVAMVDEAFEIAWGRSERFGAAGTLPTYGHAKYPLIYGGAAAAKIGFLLMLAGHFVRAMSFVPVRDVRQRDLR